MIKEKVTAAMVILHSIINKATKYYYLEFALVLAQWCHMVPQLPIKSLYVYKIHMIAIQSNHILLETRWTILKQPETFDSFVDVS